MPTVFRIYDSILYWIEYTVYSTINQYFVNLRCLHLEGTRFTVDVMAVGDYGEG